METRKKNSGAIAGGVALIAFGVLILIGQIFQRTNFWGAFWPFFPIALGVIFYVVMFAGGKSAAPFAIPATIITMIGLILLFQNLTGYWETWAYAWALIVFSVGLGIYIAGLWGDKASDRRGGMDVMKVGLILFIIFGALMELLFSNFLSRNVMQYLFPALMILLGVYLIFRPKKKPAVVTPIPGTPPPAEMTSPPEPPPPPEEPPLALQ